MESFKTAFANMSPDERKLAAYWLLRGLLGDRPEQESALYDPDGFLYLCLVPPGKRESLRLLEHPQMEKELQNASAEPTTPLREIWKELRISE